MTLLLMSTITFAIGTLAFSSTAVASPLLTGGEETHNGRFTGDQVVGFDFTATANLSLIALGFWDSAQVNLLPQESSDS